MSDVPRGPIRWLFEDRTTGRIVIGQMPNLTLWIVLIAWAAGHLLQSGRLALAARITMFVALALWAIDELARGVNPWRRLLGAGTLVGIAVWLIVLKK